MYDPLDSLLDRVKLSDIGILDRVDEYTLYCHYLGFKPLLSTSYRSFIRKEGQKADSSPSFSIFNSIKNNREYMWKDAGIGDSGDIFKLIRMMHGYTTTQQALAKVSEDFKLGYHVGTQQEKITLHPRPNNPPETVIRIHSRDFNKKDLDYWNAYGINPDILALHKVKALKYYWLFEHQPEPFIPYGMAYSYEVLSKYKIYQPHAPKQFKFRNNYDIRCLEGFAQLQYTSDTLIITKATKDIMTLRGMGYEAVAPRGENILIPNEFMAHFERKYDRIFILFDNDMKHKGDEYHHPKIYVPLSSMAKDISDFRKAYGPFKTRELMKRLIDTPLLNAA